jgi:hypothetical protein
MKKLILIIGFLIIVIGTYAQTATFGMKTEAYKTWNTNYTLTGTVPDTFLFNVPRSYPATQSYSVNLDSAGGDHTNVAVSLYGSLLGDSYTQIGSTSNWTGSSDATETVTITNTTANRYNYYKVIILGTGGTGVTTIDWQKLQTWNSGELSDGTATLSAGSFSGVVNVGMSGNLDVKTQNDSVIVDAGLGLNPIAVYINAATKFSVDSTGILYTAGDASVIGGDITGANGNAIDIGEAADGTITLSRDDAGTVVLTNVDNNANADLTVGAGGSGILTLGDAGSLTNIISSGAVSVVGPINSAIVGGTVVTSAGLLGGGGTSTSATQTLGAAGGKAFSYYLSSTSTTASDVLQGYYMNVNYGTSGSSAAPSGDVIRGRAWLVGDASGTSALTGGAFSVELAAETASNTGLTAGMRGNLVLPSAVLTNSGTYYGTMAEVFLGGAATDTRAYTEISPLGIVIGGTAATDAAQLSNMVAMAIRCPSNMVTSDATMVVTGATAAVSAGLKISINGTPYWIMLATADE